MEVTEDDFKQSLEKRFRESVMQFRDLLRWGEDKAFRQTINSVNQLFIDVRNSIDRKHYSEATEKLKLLSKNMQHITSDFPKVKRASLLETNQMIGLLSQALIADLELGEIAGEGKLNSCDKLLQHLETARFAISTEDFYLGESIVREVIRSYLLGRQRILRTITVKRLEAPVLNSAISKVNVLARRGGQCNRIANRKLESMLDRGVSSGIDSIRVLVLGEKGELNRLFSSLSRQVIDADSSDSHSLVIRIAVSRNFNIYIVGMTPDLELVSYRSLFVKFSGVLNFLQQESVKEENLRKLILSSYEQKSSANIFLANKSLVEVLGIKLVDIDSEVSSEPPILPKSESVCRWMKTELGRLSVI